jgi:hypothetical protein
MLPHDKKSLDNLKSRIFAPKTTGRGLGKPPLPNKRVRRDAPAPRPGSLAHAHAQVENGLHTLAQSRALQGPEQHFIRMVLGTRAEGGQQNPLRALPIDLKTSLLQGEASKQEREQIKALVPIDHTVRFFSNEISYGALLMLLPFPVVQKLLKIRNDAIMAMLKSWSESLHEEARLAKKAAESSQQRSQENTRVERSRRQLVLDQHALVLVRTQAAWNGFVGELRGQFDELSESLAISMSTMLGTHGLDLSPVLRPAPAAPPASRDNSVNVRRGPAI